MLVRLLRVLSCIQDCLLEHSISKPSMWCRQACGCFAHHAGRQSLTRALNGVRGEWDTLLCLVFGSSCHAFEHKDLCIVFHSQCTIYIHLYTTQSTVYFSTFFFTFGSLATQNSNWRGCSLRHEHPPRWLRCMSMHVELSAQWSKSFVRQITGKSNSMWMP